MIASHIFGLIESTIERPIGISKGWSSDEFLVRALELEEQTDEKTMEAMMAAFLSAVKNKFGYSASFVISEKTRRYYTPTGIAKIVNPQTDPYDNWYQMFLDTGLDIELTTDRDQLFDYQWSVFINARIFGSDGATLGVCGIGVFMDDWQRQILPIEKEYKVKINLIDSDGLVQIDSDFNNIKNAYISDALTDRATGNEFTYNEKGRNGYRMTRYIQNMNWYLVIQGVNHIEAQTEGKTAIICINILLLTTMIIILFGNRNVLKHDLVKTSLPEDELTGLPNRNYLKEAYGELGVFNTTRYKSLAVFDIDHFKIVNDARDGDKIILRIVEYAKDAFDDLGIIFRWSGDEFVLFLEIDIDQAEAKFKELCDKAEEELKVTVSVGIVEVDLSAPIKTNYYRAVQACYAIKEFGGNGVGKK